MNSLTFSKPLFTKPLHGHHSLVNLSPNLSNKPFFSSQKCSLGSFHPTVRISSETPFVQPPRSFSTDKFSFSPHNGPPQTPSTAKRGAAADVMGLLLRERIVFLGNPIEDFVADALISQLLLLDAQDPTKDIRLFINSPGGSLTAAMAIFDVVRLLRADVSTVVFGICASTASLVLGGGTKGKRFAMPNARIMIHQPFGGIHGPVIDVEVQSKEIIQNKNDVIRLISGFTGRTTKQVEREIEVDNYMSPIEALEYGIIDGVIDRDSIIPLVPLPPSDSFEPYDEDLDLLDVPDDEIY